ncbi:hypothetical protein [Curtobacterium flaccumfaciens]|uniref:hypothetical protein n=1 Tax=Curtobacterium flaccumfaciens TaxID=2035 RepID=UPI001E28F537|nr:hypothetical protein [Curtobacterium allii]MCE0456227.1 hypothetical protein [Curtobacterium allii]
MAPKQSATEIEARRLARGRAAAFRARQDELDKLGEGFFIAQASIETIEATAEVEIEKIRTRAAEQVADAQEKASVVMTRMLATGITRDEVGARFGIAVREVPRAKAGRAESVIDDGGAGASEETDEHSGICQLVSHDVGGEQPREFAEVGHTEGVYA